MSLISAQAARRLSGAASKTAEKGIAKEKRTRDYPDLRLSDRRDKLTEAFLKDHGFRYSETREPETFEYKGDSIIAYSGARHPSGKFYVTQKTFKNPTLKQLLDWMGY